MFCHAIERNGQGRLREGGRRETKGLQALPHLMHSEVLNAPGHLNSDWSANHRTLSDLHGIDLREKTGGGSADIH